MASINDLPAELMEMITPHLNRCEIVALRHGTRRLSMTTSEALIPTFEYLSTSCSRNGLLRLRALNQNRESDQRAAIYRAIKRITIHLPTPAELEGVRRYLPDLMTYYNKDNPYVSVYNYMQDRIFNLLLSCSNLERLILTNEPLEYDRDRLGDRVRPNYYAYLRWRAHRLLEIKDIDPFLVSVPDGPKRRPRTYGYEAILCLVNYLPRYVGVNLVIDYKHARRLDGHAFMTWDYKGGYPPRCHPRLQTTAEDIFGPGRKYDGQLNIPDILKRFLMGVTFKNGGYVDKSAHKQLYRWLEKSDVYKLTFENANYFPPHIPTLTHIVVQDSALCGYLDDFVFRHLDTLESIELLRCRAPRAGWDFLFETLGWMTKLEYVRMVRCRIGDTPFYRDEDCDHGRKFGIFWMGAKGGFGEIYGGLENLDDWEFDDYVPTET